MQKFPLFLIFAVLLLAGIVSCVDEADRSPAGKETTYTAKEAMAFFEEYMESPGISRSLGDGISLFGFDLAPDWRSARTSNNGGLFSVDVPTLSPERMILAWRGDDYRYVHVAQKLVMVKRSSDEQQGAYVLTLIPDQSYAPWWHRMDASVFVNTGDKGGYSGLAVYTSALTDRVMRVDRYENGVMVEGYGLFGTAEENVAGAQGMNGLLRGLRFRVSILDVPAGSRAMTVTSNIPCGVSVIGEVTVGACSVCRKTLHDGETCTDCCTVCCQPRLHCICCPLLGRPPCLCYAGGGGNPGDGSGGGNPTDPTPGGEGGSNGNKPGDGWKPPTDPGDGDDEENDPSKEPQVCYAFDDETKSETVKSVIEESLKIATAQEIIDLFFGDDARVILAPVPDGTTQDEMIK